MFRFCRMAKPAPRRSWRSTRVVLPHIESRLPALDADGLIDNRVAIRGGVDTLPRLHRHVQNERRQIKAAELEHFFQVVTLPLPLHPPASAKIDTQ